ncbi:hypothetical protein D3C80_2168410 [compost metagenome]
MASQQLWRAGINGVISLGKTEAYARITIPTGRLNAQSAGVLYSRYNTRTAKTIIIAKKVINSYILLTGI